MKDPGTLFKHPREMTLAELEDLPVAIRLRRYEFRFIDSDHRMWRVGQNGIIWSKVRAGDSTDVALALPQIGRA